MGNQCSDPKIEVTVQDRNLAEEFWMSCNCEMKCEFK